MEKGKKKKRKDHNIISIKSDLSSVSQILESINSSHCKESDHYDWNIVDKHCVESRKEMNKIYNKHRLKYELLQLLVDLEYD